MGTGAIVIDPTNYGNPPGDGPLRPGGVSASLPVPSDADLPSTKCAGAKRQESALDTVRDLWGGTESVRQATVKYLPKAPAETAAAYAERLARAVFVNVFRRTIELLVGYVFRVDPVLGDDVPPRLVDLWENVDLAGTHGDVFCRELLQEAMHVGHVGIFTDYPDTQGRTITLAQETGASGLRPYLRQVLKDDMVSWRTVVEDGRTVLVQLVLRERTMVPVGAFGEAEQTRYRVFTRTPGQPRAPGVPGKPVVSWRLLAVNNRVVSMVAEGLCANQTEIPLAEVTTVGSRGLLDSDPPFIDLAYLNIAHYQQRSDYATSIYKTCVPVLFTKGFIMKDEQGNELVVGPNSGLNSENPDGDAKYISHDGQSLDACRQALEDLKTEMAMFGTAALASEKRAAETEGAKRIAKSGTDSALAVMARGLQDALEQSLQYMANYMRLPDGGSITINRDFDVEALQADMLTALVTAVEKVGLPERVLLANMRDGGLLPEDDTVDGLALEMQANAAAIAEAERQAQADALAAQAQRLQPGTGAPGRDATAPGKPADAGRPAPGDGTTP